MGVRSALAQVAAPPQATHRLPRSARAIHGQILAQNGWQRIPVLTEGVEGLVSVPKIDRRTKIAVKRKRRRRLIPLRAPGDHFTTHAYDHAIAHACVRAGVPHWSPNQLRHNAATRVRNAYGIEAARIILGHASAVTSEIYAEIDRERAKEIMQKLG